MSDQPKLVNSTRDYDEYEISMSLQLTYYKSTKEFTVTNLDTGEEFLLAEDYEEAAKLCNLILSLIEGEK